MMRNPVEAFRKAREYAELVLALATVDILTDGMISRLINLRKPRPCTCVVCKPLYEVCVCSSCIRCGCNDWRQHHPRDLAPPVPIKAQPIVPIYTPRPYPPWA